GGVDGLLHVADISHGRVSKPADVLAVGQTVDVQVLKVDPVKRRISLGMKQLTADPWSKAAETYKTGERAHGVVTRVTDFGAFVELGDGIEGMIHVGDLSAEKRINHPQEVVKQGQAVRTVVLDVDREKRRIRLGVKQLQPTSIDEYIAEHKEGDVVTGRVADVSGGKAKVELGEGVRATCPVSGESFQSAAATG